MRKIFIFIAGFITGRYVITFIDKGMSALLFGHYNYHYIPYNKQNTYSYTSTYSSYLNNRRKYKTEDDVVFKTRSEAEKVLDTLNDTIEMYGYTTIGDLFDAADVEYYSNPYYINENYGWRNLKDALVIKCIGGYKIKFPQKEYLKEDVK